MTPQTRSVLFFELFLYEKQVDINEGREHSECGNMSQDPFFG